MTMPDDPEASHGEVADWVQCDRCSKWRRVPQSVAEALTDDTTWYCEQNRNAKYASCSAPQELSDEEIDQAQDERDAGGDGRPRPKLPAIWQLIASNAYSHRKRKEQDDDEIMVCHCPPPWRGGDGCGPDCLNRMLCIECTEGYCPCEQHCNNQAFTRRQYKKLSVRRAGAKGFGLFAEEAIAGGSFVIEYIGEVLEEEEYMRRRDFYAEVGQRHYYFMNIGNGEVIDACRKGNYGRFINHSCNPNCETQKWMVRGELAIGFFTLRDVKVGEELTFDYNFERYGDKPMRCYCGSKKCRKFIGGTQETMAAVAGITEPEDVSADPEPVMVRVEETDGVVQAMLDTEVGSTARGWDARMLSRLQHMCKARGINWSSEQQAAALATVASSGALDGADATGGGDSESGEAEAAAVAPRRAARRGGLEEDASSDESSDHSAVAAAAAKRRPPAGKARARQRQRPAAKRTTAAAAAAAVSDDAPAASAGVGADDASAASSVPSVAAPPRKAAGKGGRLVRRKASEAGGTREEEDAAGAAPTAGDTGVAASSAPRRVSGSGAAASAPAPAPPSRPPSRGSDGGDDDDGDAAAAAAAAGPGPGSSAAAAAAASGGSGRPPMSQRREGSGALGSSAAAAAPPKRSFLTLPGIMHVLRPGFKRRSEIDRRLEGLLRKESRKLRDQSRDGVVKVLRLFNLCDISGRGADRAGGGHGASADAALARSGSQQPQQHHHHHQQHHHQHLNGDRRTSSGGGGAGLAAAGDDGALAAADGATSGAAPSSSPRDDAGAHALPLPPPPLPPPPHPTPHHHHHQQQQQRDASPPPSQAAHASHQGGGGGEGEARMRARQRARLLDLGLLLDVVLETGSDKLKREYVDCGILSQLQAVLGRIPFTKEYSVLLVKVSRLLEFLPLTSDDLYTTRTAHGTFADVLRKMASVAADWEVRRRSHQLIVRYPASACSDATLAQLHSLPAPSGRGSYLMHLRLAPAHLQRLMPLLAAAAAPAPAAAAPAAAAAGGGAGGRRAPPRGAPPPAASTPGSPPGAGAAAAGLALPPPPGTDGPVSRWAAPLAPPPSEAPPPVYMAGSQPVQLPQGGGAGAPAAGAGPGGDAPAAELLAAAVREHERQHAYLEAGPLLDRPHDTPSRWRRGGAAGPGDGPGPGPGPALPFDATPWRPAWGGAGGGGGGGGPPPGGYGRRGWRGAGPPPGRHRNRFNGGGAAAAPGLRDGAAFGGGGGFGGSPVRYPFLGGGGEAPDAEGGQPKRRRLEGGGSAAPFVVGPDGLPLLLPGPPAEAPPGPPAPAPLALPPISDLHHDGEGGGRRGADAGGAGEAGGAFARGGGGGAVLTVPISLLSDDDPPPPPAGGPAPKPGPGGFHAASGAELAGVEELWAAGAYAGWLRDAERAALDAAGEPAAAAAAAGAPPLSPLVAGAFSPLLGGASTPPPLEPPALPPPSVPLGVEDWWVARARDPVLSQTTPGVALRALALPPPPPLLHDDPMDAQPPSPGSAGVASALSAAARPYGYATRWQEPPAQGEWQQQQQQQQRSLPSPPAHLPLPGFGSLAATARQQQQQLPPPPPWGPAAAGTAMSRTPSAAYPVTPPHEQPFAGGGPPFPPPPSAAAAATAAAAASPAAAADAEADADAGGGSFPALWDEPDASFESFVGETVKRRLGKYVQPDHPNRISRDEAQALYRKLKREVVEKERSAAAERAAAGGAAAGFAPAPLERKKLESNIKEFVRLSIRRLHAQRGGSGAS